MRRDMSDPQFHRTIGLVYDSALDTGVWPTALEALCGLFDGFMYGSISVMDPVLRSNRLAREWCADPEWPKWRQLLVEKYEAQIPFYENLSRCDIGTVHNTEDGAGLMGMTVEDAYRMPFFTEWALPAGRRDSLGSVIMRSANRFGYFAMHSRTDRGMISREELAFAALLVPHVRRAACISDVLGTAVTRISTLQATLDAVPTAVVVTDAHAKVVLANAAGDAMLRTGAPIGAQNGELRAAQPAATNALRTAISRSDDPVPNIGSSGIGVPLTAGDGSPAVAHILPLAAGGAHRDWGAKATAAVFVAPVEHALPEIDALIGLFALTPMEARIVLEIATGKRRSEAAAALGISDNTAKTHLERAFDKTGVGDQASLSRLVASLGPPGRQVT